MKTLFIIADLFGPPGGIARYAQMVCKSLLNAGYVVVAVVLADELKTAVPAPFTNQAFNYYPCGGSRLAFAKECIKIIIHEKPALILVGHVNFSPLGYGLAQLSGAKWGTFIYGIDVWQPLPWHRRLAAQQSDQLIAISKFTAQQAAQHNDLNKNGEIQILHNCLAPSFETELTATATSTSDLALLTVARTTLAEQYKGHDYVIQAMPILQKRFPQLIYHIVGDGDWQPALKDLANELGVGDKVLFHGRVSDEALLQHYLDATLFVMPSRCEGFGFVFIEAMAHGIPAIGGDLDATPEVIIDGQTGYVVDPTSIDDIVAAISYLLENPNVREQMGRNAQQHVQDSFSFDCFQQTLNGLLGKLSADTR